MVSVLTLLHVNHLLIANNLFSNLELKNLHYAGFFVFVTFIPSPSAKG